MRKTNSIALMGCACLLLSYFTHAQCDSDLATWNLLSESVTTEAANVDASAFDYGIATAGNTGLNGAIARGWPLLTKANLGDYYEVCLSPDPGRTMKVTGITFGEMRSKTGPRAYQLLASNDGFQTFTQISNVALPDNESERVETINGLELFACESEAVCFRWYAYDSDDNNGTWTLTENRLAVQGCIFASCTAPATQPNNLSFSNLSGSSMQIDIGVNGTGDNRIIIMREGSAVTAVPCSGKNYTANTTFGMGAEAAANEFVVFSGSGNSVSVTNLVDGAIYHVAVFEYNGIDYCYAQSDPLTGFQTTLCAAPSEVNDFDKLIGNGDITLNWKDPSCFDEVLIVASTASVTGIPTNTDGSNYTPDAEYGQGTDSGGDFTGTEFPVFKGVIDQTVTIESLTDETEYFFKVFVRKGGVWSDGIEIKATPTSGCLDLGDFDKVFINEIHYYLDIDAPNGAEEGVELAGPAGTDLSDYELHFYKWSDRSVYLSESLSGSIDDEGNGFGAVWFPFSDPGGDNEPGDNVNGAIEDGRGGVVLYNTSTNTVVQFLSYSSGASSPFVAADGVANGEMATSMGISIRAGTYDQAETVQMTSSDPNNQGKCPSSFEWKRQISTRGTLNGNQFLLPIELISFTATQFDQRILLKWQTATELNNDYMAVERSFDGFDFEEIGRVQGAGTAFDPQSYQLWDEKPRPGLNYYRLRQVDFDGTEQYFKVIAVQVNSESRGEVLVFPNPTIDQISISLDQPLEKSGSLKIVDMHGRTRIEQDLDRGSLSSSINLNQLPSGHYLLWIDRGEEPEIKRFVKL